MLFVRWLIIDGFQKPRSRHDELKERARLLLEQARREATNGKSLDRNDSLEKRLSPGDTPVSEVTDILL